MWGSRMIHTVCMSSAESETSAAVMCTKDMLNMRLLLWELGYEQIGSSPISADNQATVKSASGNAQSKQSKYYQMRALFLRHYVRLGKIHFGYIPGAEQIADQLTKAQPTARFKEHRAAILGRPPDTFDE